MRLNHDQPVPQEIIEYVEVLAQDIDAAVEHCTPYGKGLKLLSNKPDDPYYAYVWRMARFHSGEDMRMPMGAFWDIAQGIEQDFEVSIGFYLLDDSRKKVLDILDGLSDKLLTRIGYSTNRAAIHWGSVVAGMGNAG